MTPSKRSVRAFTSAESTKPETGPEKPIAGLHGPISSTLLPVWRIGSHLAVIVRGMVYSYEVKT